MALGKPSHDRVLCALHNAASLHLFEHFQSMYWSTYCLTLPAQLAPSSMKQQIAADFQQREGMKSTPLLTQGVHLNATIWWLMSCFQLVLLFQLPKILVWPALILDSNLLQHLLQPIDWLACALHKLNKGPAGLQAPHRGVSSGGFVGNWLAWQLPT